jgi:AcrR family transcriptional regulator
VKSTPDVEAAEPELTIRRPTREDAIVRARAHFVAGERVEMQGLAAELDIGRTTLYRWTGERDQLMGEIIGRLVDEWVASVESQATGTGVARLLETLRRFLELAAGSPPLTAFTEREPGLALRVLMDRGGRVAERSRDALRRNIEEAIPTLEVPPDIIEAISMTATSLVWANIAAAQEPDIDGAITVANTLLSACESPS